MEKSVVLGLASGTKQVSASMARLVCYYAELLASQGLLTTALEYLNLSSSDDAPEELKALRDRITQSIQGTQDFCCLTLIIVLLLLLLSIC